MKLIFGKTHYQLLTSVTQFCMNVQYMIYTYIYKYTFFPINCKSDKISMSDFSAHKPVMFRHYFHDNEHPQSHSQNEINWINIRFLAKIAWINIDNHVLQRAVTTHLLQSPKLFFAHKHSAMIGNFCDHVCRYIMLHIRDN